MIDLWKHTMTFEMFVTKEVSLFENVVLTDKILVQLGFKRFY